VPAEIAVPEGSPFTAKSQIRDFNRGSTVSKVLGLTSVPLLAWGVYSILVADWVSVLGGVVGATFAAYGGYRAAGGRHNPELAKAAWEPRNRIDVVSDRVASWPAKVEAMFSMLEEESAGDYAAALASLKLHNVPGPVEAAYTDALQAPSTCGVDPAEDHLP
jgi:hypothetical protein